jgi:hypothetical protein
MPNNTGIPKYPDPFRVGEGRPVGRAADKGIGCHEEKEDILVCQGGLGEGESV